jgi:hypothetical protein
MPVNSALSFFWSCGFIALRISCPFSFRKRFVASAENKRKVFPLKNNFFCVCNINREQNEREREEKREERTGEKRADRQRYEEVEGIMDLVLSLNWNLSCNVGDL